MGIWGLDWGSHQTVQEGTEHSGMLGIGLSAANPGERDMGLSVRAPSSRSQPCGMTLRQVCLFGASFFSNSFVENAR